MITKEALEKLAQVVNGEGNLCTPHVFDNYTWVTDTRAFLAVDGVPGEHEDTGIRVDFLMEHLQTPLSGACDLTALRAWLPSPRMEPCSCGGTGEITCPDCGGDPSMECPHCGHDTWCDRCEGTGKVDCRCEELRYDPKQGSIVVAGKDVRVGVLRLARFLSVVPDGHCQIGTWNMAGWGVPGLLLNGSGWGMVVAPLEARGDGVPMFKVNDAPIPQKP